MGWNLKTIATYAPCDNYSSIVRYLLSVFLKNVKCTLLGETVNVSNRENTTGRKTRIFHSPKSFSSENEISKKNYDRRAIA